MLAIEVFHVVNPSELPRGAAGPTEPLRNACAPRPNLSIIRVERDGRAMSGPGSRPGRPVTAEGYARSAVVTRPRRKYLEFNRSRCDPRRDRP